MRLLGLSSALAALLSITVLADSIPSSTQTPTSTTDDYRAEITPFPGAEVIDDGHHHEIRQVLQVQPDAEQAGTQVPPVTIYSIATQVGATGEVIMVTYTQLFSAVPDQWPSPKVGTIGMGTLGKRSVEARDTEVQVVEIEQPVVLVQETEAVTVPLQKVTEVVILQEVFVSDPTIINNGTGSMQALSGTAPAAALGSAAFRPKVTGVAAATGAPERRPSGFFG